MNIIIYTNPHCLYSDQAKKFFQKRKIPFEEKTLFKEEENCLEMIKKTGQMSTPVILIGDEMLIGFDEEKIKKILKKDS